MKFHNQRSFMGHEISNVNNKPLLHKKGKQWIVVAISALVLAGFGGMVSTTTHADTTAQPTTTKVAPKPANTSSAKSVAPKATQPNVRNIGQQATNLHKNLLTNAPTSNPAPHNLEDSNIQAQGYWDYGNHNQDSTSAKWTLDKQGNLNISGKIGHKYDSESNFFDALGTSYDNTRQIKTVTFSNATAPADSGRLFDDEAGNHFPNLYQINLNGLDLTHATTTCYAMFGGLRDLQNVIGLTNFPNGFNASWLFVDDPKLTSVDLSKMSTMGNDNYLFDLSNQVHTITLGSNNYIDGNAFLGDGVNSIPQSQQKWTNLQGQTVDLTKSGAKLQGGIAWNAGNEPLKATDTIIYKNAETGQIVKANNDYNSNSIKPPVNTDYGYITGPYGANPKFDWTNYGIHTISDRSNSNLNVLYNDNVAFGWQALPNQSVPTINGGTYVIMIRPDPISATINYYDGNSKVGSHTFNGDNNVTGATHATFDASSEAPAGYHTTGNTTFTYSNIQNSTNVQVAPDTDFLNYYINNTNNGPIIGSTSDNIVNNTSLQKGPSNFTIPLGYNHDLPTGYHIVSGDGISDSANHNDGLTFNYQNGSHKVLIAPNIVTDTITYENGSNPVATAKYSGNDFQAKYAKNTTFNANNNVPAGYHATGNTTFYYDGGNHTVSVKPIYKTDTVDYVYNHNYNNINVSSTKDNGADISTFNANDKVPAGYRATTANNLPYNGKTYTVNIEPDKDTDTIHYQYNGKTSATQQFSGNDYRATSAGNNSVDITSANEPNIPLDYQLVNSDNTIQFDNKTHDVAIKPVQKSDVVDYMNNDLNIASDVYTGNDMYANGASDTTFDANTKVPAGYHVANDGGNTFYFDGQKHDVTVYPNSITLEFNNGQAGSKKIDNLKGDTYQIKSSDVPANYQLTNPSDDVIDLGNLGNNIDYNVDVSPVPQSVTPTTPSAASNDNVQPSVPYIPSMSVSSAASASSASSAIVAPSSVASQTNVAPSASAPVTHRYYHSHYSHYRYAKVVTPLQLHTSKHFTDKNGVLVIKHPTEFRIMRIVRDHKYARYEVRYNHKNYFITANPKFTINDYVQKGDFKSRKHMMVRVITPLIEYKRSHFSKKYAIKVFKKGAVLPVKRVLPFGKGEMTRFQLTNGRYVTSNKLFVKVIK